jgi:transcriptional regulator with XRE-family HTH domain
MKYENEGLKIKNYLDSHGISQAHISRQTSISPAALNSSLKGKRKLKLEEYANICGVLGVNTDYFIKPRTPEGKEIA